MKQNKIRPFLSSNIGQSGNIPRQSLQDIIPASGQWLSRVRKVQYTLSAATDFPNLKRNRTQILSVLKHPELSKVRWEQVDIRILRKSWRWHRVHSSKALRFDRFDSMSRNKRLSFFIAFASSAYGNIWGVMPSLLARVLNGTIWATVWRLLQGQDWICW
jgi:hypothetical protein